MPCPYEKGGDIGSSLENRVTPLFTIARQKAELHFRRLKTGTGLTDRQLILLALLALAVAGLVGLMTAFLPPAIDWHGAFRPAARAALVGQAPYDTPGYVYPPWALIPLIPLAVLPEAVGRAALLIVSLIALLFAAYRLGATRTTAILFLLSPPVLHGLLNGNIDWLVILGFVLPPRIGLFFVAIKPQMGLTIGLYWLVEAWREGSLRQVVTVFWPVTLAMLLSFLLFGLWPLRFTVALTERWNASLWPLSIPVGLALMATAIRQRQREYAMGAAPCLSPFVNFHSWSGALMAVTSRPLETSAAVVGLWAVVLLRAIEQ